MTPDRTRWCELLVGLERVEVLDVLRLLEHLVVTVESTDRLMGCGACGTRARVKDRDRVALADLPAFGCPVTLVWLKRRWRCGETDCGAGTWTEDRPDIAPARSTMTRRAGVWATAQVGRHVHSVAWAAKERGVGWHTVMDAVSLWGEVLVEHPDRVGATSAIGVDRRDVLQHIADWAGDRLHATQVCDLADAWLASDVLVSLDAGPRREGRSGDVVRLRRPHRQRGGQRGALHHLCHAQCRAATPRDL